MKLTLEINELRKRYGDFKAVEMIKEAGFDAIDYSYYELSEDSSVLGEGYREYALELRKHLDDNNIECRQAHAPFVLGKNDKLDMSEPKYVRVVRSIESAAILGAKNIIVHPIYVPVGETINGISYEEYNESYYKSLAPYCEKAGICVAVENMFWYDEKCLCRRGMLSTPETLSDMVRRIGSPYFVACLDVGHAAITEVEPHLFIKGMDKNVLKALHIQDTDYLADRHVMPYMGNIDWDAVMKSLKEIGYEGDLTYEIGSFLDKIPSEALPYALKMAESVGRVLIKKYEDA